MEEMTTVKVAGVALVEEAVAFLVAEYLEAPEVACSAVGDPALVQAVDCLEAGLEAVDLEEMTTAKATGTNSVEDKEVDFSGGIGGGSRGGLFRSGRYGGSSGSGSFSGGTWKQWT
ncbi:hypothetical protein MRX96_019704 [Rhipicephalus microplus]